MQQEEKPDDVWLYAEEFDTILNTSQGSDSPSHRKKQASRTINTEGAYIGGSLKMSGGKFAGRDQFNQTTNYHVESGGTLIDGDNNTVVGERGVSIKGRVDGSVVTGNNNQIGQQGKTPKPISQPQPQAMLDDVDDVVEPLAKAILAIEELTTASKSQKRQLVLLTKQLQQEIGKSNQQNTAALEKIAQRVKRLAQDLQENDTDLNEANRYLLEKATDPIKVSLPRVSAIATMLIKRTRNI